MTKKLPSGHNLGGSTKHKRRKEHKQESDYNFRHKSYSTFIIFDKIHNAIFFR